MTMRIGGYDVIMLEAGPFKLDGGGLFGVVPKVMWNDRAAPDPFNRVRIGCASLLLAGHGHRVVIETGCGDKFDDKEREFYGIENPGGLLGALAGRGVDPGSIDAVIVSHLHFDHVGGATTRDATGRIVPAFPNGRLFTQRREWQDAVANRSHMKTTYRAEDLAALDEAGLVELVEGPAEILPNIRVEPAPGHTWGQQQVVVGGAAGGETLCFTGDNCATSWHLRPYWTMGFDIEPATVNVQRAELIRRAVAGNWVLVFPHDPAHSAGRVRLDEKGRWRFEPVEI